MFNQLLLEKVLQEQMLRSLGCRMFRGGPRWKEVQVSKTGRERSRTVTQAWERLGRPTGSSGWNTHAVTVVPWWGQAFKPVHDSLLDMGFLGEDAFLGRTASAGVQEGSWWYISLQLPDPFWAHCQVVMLIEFTCQDILLIKWIILHRVLCTG